MRIPAEIAFILLLLFLGWRQPYRQHLEHLFPDRFPPALPAAAATPEPVMPLPASTPALKATPPPRSEAWLWEPKPMDKPYNSNGTGRVPGR